MIRLLSFFQLPEFRAARNPANFRNIPEAGGSATALIGVEKQGLLAALSPFRSKSEVAL